jgi:hypothetical protein
MWWLTVVWHDERRMPERRMYTIKIWNERMPGFLSDEKQTERTKPALSNPVPIPYAPSSSSSAIVLLVIVF